MFIALKQNGITAHLILMMQHIDKTIIDPDLK